MTMLSWLADAYDIVVTDHKVVGSEDGVLLEQTMTFTSRATGRATSLKGVELWRFRDGTIADIEVDYQDTQAMVAVTTGPGAGPPPRRSFRTSPRAAPRPLACWRPDVPAKHTHDGFPRALLPRQDSPTPRVASVLD